jgi:peptidoglycan-N-acetylmuramic acid deacetylase
MAKKKKKNDKKTLKAMIIFIFIISFICIAVSLGNSALNSSENESNNDVVGDDIKNANSNENKVGTDNDTESQSEKQPETPQQPEAETKPEPIEPEEDQDQTNPDEEEPQGSGLEDNFDMNVDIATLSNTEYGWWWKRNKEHIKPIAYNKFDIVQYGGYYAVDTNEKVIYLTFDEGYENGFTPTILDILKANNVKATFFVTYPFIKNNKELVIRMKEEGHIVGNHSVNHKNTCELTEDEIKYEIEETARYFEEVTGYKMDLFFRPPEGKYSERTLYLTRKLGYRTIFWSMAYEDWKVNEQPGKEAAFKHVMENYHPGMISLLHAVSSSNTEALDDIIKSLKKEGYRFGNLYEVE